MEKVAVITGASCGIGRATARRLGLDGYGVAVLYHRHEAEAKALCEELKQQGIRGEAFFCDVSDAAQVKAMATAVQQTLGQVSVLVNNAGIAQQKLFTDLTDEDWRRMMAVHVDGTFYTCRAFLPDMLRRHEGAIVNVSSMWGQVGGSCEVHYSAAKAAVIGLTKALAKEVGPSGVRVNCVAPGVIDTAMLDSLTQEERQDLAQEAPLCRLGTPDDVAWAISYLVSEKAAFLTGQVLAPNGGIVI